ncbi:inter-alpha-trypsin inhibitor heavy chain H4-like [Periplaneta americana]|uniref:inter-alpha-trypsin inhibitor heavy chain H4-like n=1 Tax=Periplaneta americana TaxID=6978 RepID=UPI0037E8C75A
MRTASIVLLVLCCYQRIVTLAAEGSDSSESDEDATPRLPKPVILYLRINSDIQFRYARTVVTSRISNPANASQEVSFSAVLPDSAFISGFHLLVDNVVYNAFVREKEEAVQEYSTAVREGRTAAHVALSARDSKRFTVSVNIEPQKKVNFKLTYEELLARELGTYKHVVSLDPGQIVRELSVVTRIKESSNITTLRVPALRLSNEILTTESNNSLATIERPSPVSAIVKFNPTEDEQRELSSEGIQGQLVVEYDVDRTAQPGVILVNEGYFVHFFVPEDMPPLKKHVIFVLDVSGSMRGRKIEQLTEAMTRILDDLNDGDYFSIVPFSTTVQVWDHNATDLELRSRIQRLGESRWGDYGEEEETQTLASTVIATTSEENINSAKEFTNQLRAVGATNINDALVKALQISKLGRTTISLPSGSQLRPEPIIVFLTDGKANVGTSDPKRIITNVGTANTLNASIFSLALGGEADFPFLKKLSLRNSGFARKIYEASDTALQLRDFYRQVSSPLLANVTFKYRPEQVVRNSLSRKKFRRVFSGSELVVAGRLQSDNSSATGQVKGQSASGNTTYPFTPTVVQADNATGDQIVSPMERMWAYVTIQQLLNEKEAEISDDDNESWTYFDSYEDQIEHTGTNATVLDLALRYSFVTPLTSLVVVKPNGTSAVNTEDASGQATQGHSSGTRTTGSRPGLSSPNYNYEGGRIAPSRGGNVPTPIPEPPIQLALANLSDVTWLRNLTANNAVSLPTGLNGTTEVFRMAGANETNVAYTACTTPGNESGHCRLFRYCVLNIFVNDQTQFHPYFCRIESYAGVCCPDSLQS